MQPPIYYCLILPQYMQQNYKIGCYPLILYFPVILIYSVTSRSYLTLLLDLCYSGSQKIPSFLDWVAHSSYDASLLTQYSTSTLQDTAAFTYYHRRRNYRIILLHCVDDGALTQVAQRGGRLSLLGYLQKPPGCGLEPPAVGGPA